tara:strand:- start:64 stop:384 length:321 start_codon:yes stop_codon:yes gene_type:complete
MKTALLWVVTYNQTEDTLSAVFTNKDDAVNEYEIRCSEKLVQFASLNKVTFKSKSTRELASALVSYGAELGGSDCVDGPGGPPRHDTVETYFRQTEDLIATQHEYV